MFNVLKNNLFMETKFLNFERLEVTGTTKEEAFSKAPFTIVRDVTPSFNAWKDSKTDGITDNDIKAFLVEKLAEHTKNAPGLGISITYQSAVSDTRKRPYTYKDIKNEQGKRSFKTFYQWKDKKTNQVVLSVDTTKADAAAKAKELIKDGKLRGSYYLTVVKEVVKGEPILAEIEYTPSSSSKVGRYLVAGIKNS